MKQIIPIGALLVGAALAAPQDVAWAQETESEEHASGSGTRLGSQRNWLFRSFLQDEGDDADTLGIEFESFFSLGHHEMSSRSPTIRAPFQGNPWAMPCPVSGPPRASTIY